MPGVVVDDEVVETDQVEVEIEDVVEVESAASGSAHRIRGTGRRTGSSGSDCPRIEVQAGPDAQTADYAHTVLSQNGDPKGRSVERNGNQKDTIPEYRG